MVLAWLSVACRPAADPQGGPPAPPTLPSAPLPAGAVILPDVTVIDADGAVGPVTLVLEGTTIAAILDVPPTDPGDATVLDTAGAWVTPGLVDPHVHLFLSSTPLWVGDTLAANLASYLWFGVTTVVDAGGPVETLALRDRIAEGDIVGPSVLALGPFVTSAGSHPCEVWNDPDSCVFVDDATTGASAAATLLDAGSDGIKVALADAAFTGQATPRLDPDAAAAALGAATSAGAFSYAHVDTEADALEAIDSGATTLAHTPFAAALSSAGTASIAAWGGELHTTLGAFDGLQALLAGQLLPEDRGPLSTRMLASFDTVAQNPGLVDLTFLANTAEWAVQAAANADALAAAGATVRPASDGGYWYVPPGWGLHRELAALQVRGSDPLDLLTAATTVLPDRGRIAVGQRADLLVLRADPLDGLTALAEPEWVILAGEVLLREDLRDLDLLRAPASGTEGDFCLDERDCPDGACDLAIHRCTSTCDTAFALSNACGPSAWCLPADGITGSPVCHAVDQTCDLYAASCVPATYGERCAPLDLDTNACEPAGPRTVGQTCSRVDPTTMCGAGLFCSAIDLHCYTLCDPAEGQTQSTCGAGKCLAQEEAGEVWFGLCFGPL